MKNNPLYFRWLYALVSKPGLNYRKVLVILSEKSFSWTVPNDDNRVAEGKKLRQQYEEDTGRHFDIYDRPCSVLEMMIALSGRIQYIMDDSRGDETARWFWEIFDNLGLGRFTDDSLMDERAEAKIDKILDTLVNRTYDRLGRGSLFPLRRTRKDMSETEIWYQLMAYLDENYAS